MSFSTTAQYYNPNTFHIDRPINSSTFNKLKVGDIHSEQLDVIFRSSGSEEIMKHYNLFKGFKTSANVTRILLMVSVAKELYELKDLEIWQRASAASSFQPSSRFIKGGTILLVLSTVSTYISNRHLKKSMKLYNEIPYLERDQLAQQFKYDPGQNIGKLFKISINF